MFEQFGEGCCVRVRVAYQAGLLIHIYWSQEFNFGA